MTHENCPQELTADEKGLGFEHLVLEAYGLQLRRFHRYRILLLLQTVESI